MKKPIALAFSDIHFNMWSKFNTNNERTLAHLQVLSYIMKACEEHSVGYVLFGGDFFHKPENIDASLFQPLANFICKKLNRWDRDIIGISGNHDMKLNNTLEKPSPSLWYSICQLSSSLHCIDWESRDIGTAVVHGIPYLDRNLGLNDQVNKIKLTPHKKNILLLHTDYPGAKDNDGSVVDSVENLNTNLLNRFDLVLIGHIHKPQRLSKKVYMIGATHQQRRTDRNCELGYSVIYDDMSVKLVSLSDKLPKFIDVETPEEVLDDGNYYTVISKNNKLEPASEDVNMVTVGLSTKKLVRSYLRTVGVKDINKRKLLISTINKVGND